MNFLFVSDTIQQEEIICKFKMHKNRNIFNGSLIFYLINK